MPKRSLLVTLVALLTAGAAAADDLDPTKEVAAEEEAKRLEGTWEVVYYEKNGRAVPEKDGTKVVFASGRVRFDDEPEKKYRVEPGTRPAWLDFESVWVDRKVIGNQVDMRPLLCLPSQGIYQRQGDRMTLCYSGGAFQPERPTAFRTAADRPGTLMTLMSLRRVQPKAK